MISGLVGFGFMVFNTTFNNISDIPWRSVLTSKQNFFFLTTRELEYLGGFFRAKRVIVFQNLTLGYMTITLNQRNRLFFFSLPKSEYFFQQYWESEYFFKKEKT
jgi:hypothetical protein